MSAVAHFFSLVQDGQTLPESKEKAVRIVSTGRQGRNPLWVSVEKEKTKSSESGTRTHLSVSLCSSHFILSLTRLCSPLQELRLRPKAA